MPPELGLLIESGLKSTDGLLVKIYIFFGMGSLGNLGLAKVGVNLEVNFEITKDVQLRLILLILNCYQIIIWKSKNFCNLWA